MKSDKMSVMPDDQVLMELDFKQTNHLSCRPMSAKIVNACL